MENITLAREKNWSLFDSIREVSKAKPKPLKDCFQLTRHYKNVPIEEKQNASDHKVGRLVALQANNT
jgi:hypothetical protein